MTARTAPLFAPASLMALSVVGGIGVQVFLAGLAIFGGPVDWGMHGMFGGLLSLPILALGAMGMMRRGALPIAGPRCCWCFSTCCRWPW